MPVGTFSLPDDIVVRIFEFVREPAVYARSACVSRQCCTVSKLAAPHRLILDWDNEHEGLDFQFIDGLIDWMCDKLWRGRLFSLKDLTLVVLYSIYIKHEEELRVKSIKTLMKSLPLYSCTFDSHNILEDVYNFLPDSIREVWDGNNQDCLEVWQCALAPSCFRHISTYNLSSLFLDPTHDWMQTSQPVCLQHLTVRDYFDVHNHVLDILATAFPVLESIDVTVPVTKHTELVLDHMLQLPKLQSAHFRFTRNSPLSDANMMSSIVLSVPATLKQLSFVPLDGLKVGRQF